MEQQTQAIAALHPDLFKASRTGIDVASDQIIDLVRSGERNPLEVGAWVKAVEEVLERVKKEIKESQLTEAGKYPEKTFTVYGTSFTKAEHGTKYDYAACGDTVWERLHSDLEVAKSRLSEREAFLRALKSPEVVVDQVAGEMVTITPPVKTSVSGLNVVIK